MQDIEKIYQEYANMLYKYVFCLTGKEDISEEIVQETFEVAIKNINKFEGKCKISTWLCQIAKYIWYGKTKKKNRLKEVPLDDINELKEDSIIEEKISKNQDKIQLFKNIQKLDEDTKNVIYLRILGNLTYKEIAEVMGKSETWARVIFFRGKQKLKDEEIGK